MDIDNPDLAIDAILQEAEEDAHIRESLARGDRKPLIARIEQRRREAATQLEARSDVANMPSANSIRYLKYRRK